MGPDLNRPAVPAPSAAVTSFAPSFAFLRGDRRSALSAVYAFCRATDDLADAPDPAPLRLERLAAWRADLDRALAGEPAAPVLTQLAAAAAAHRIPAVHFHDLLRGAAMDATVTRYATFAELEAYCRLVASAVGLMCLDIFGRRNDRTEAYAGALGVALQLTNIVRDVAADAAMGRIYLPLEDLSRFGASPESIALGEDSPALRRAVAAVADRSAEFYDRADAALERSDLAAMRPARVMQALYRRILDDARRSGFDVFRKRARVGATGKAAVLFRYAVLDRLYPR